MMGFGIKMPLAGLAAIAAIGVSPGALACGIGALPATGTLTSDIVKSSLWASSEPSLASDSYRPDDNNRPDDKRTMVGMWSFKFTAGANTVDFGYVQWHSDGTELMNSGGRAPATENFCMGVWRQVGPGRFHLNHLALSYDSSGVLNARVNIKEDLTVEPNGQAYVGTFTLDVYDPRTNVLLQHVAGTATGQRILPD